ncbi:MAG: hypothetical protein GY775_13125, partial [Candidatus Scalindua sp.]|nr:hypothetical protein [Candidatus Scalindua sp.]
MPHIITRDDAQNFLESCPVAADIDLLDKDELLVLAHHLKLGISAGSTKSTVADMIKLQLCGDTTASGGAVGEMDNSSVEGSVDFNGDTVQDNPALSQDHYMPPLPGSLPLGYTAEQYLELARINAGARQAQADHEFRMAQLSQTNTNTAVPPPPQGLTMSGVIPPFTEDHVDDFFVLFEEVAKGMKWSKEQWPFMLQTVLTGRARTTYVSVEAAVRQDYDSLKIEILKAYQLRPEAYRQSFRKTHKKAEETHTIFAKSMTKVFNQWLNSKDVTDYNGLKELVLMENFLWKIDPQVAYHLRGKKVDCLTDAAALADDYVLNSVFRGKKPFENSGNRFNKYSKNNNNNNNHNAPSPKPSVTPSAQGTQGTPRVRIAAPTRNEGKSNTSQRMCTYCGKHGHLAYNCWLKEKYERAEREKLAKPVAVVCDGTQVKCENGVIACVNQHAGPSPVMCIQKPIIAAPDTYLPFISSGTVNLNGTVHEVRILRDTGASHTLLLNPSPTVCLTNDHVVLRGAGGPFSVPLTEVEIECDLYKGYARVGLAEELPVPGVDLLLGNDLAGERVQPDPILSVVPVFMPLTGVLEKEIPEAFPVCAVTRSMANVANPSVPDNPPNAPSVVADRGDEATEVSLVQTPPEFEISLADTFMADLNDNVPDNLSPNHQSGL